MSKLTSFKLSEIYEANRRLDGIIHHTPLNRSATFSVGSGNEIFLKKENEQKTGSFKVRGAANKIAKLVAEKDCKVMVAASAGNHAQGVAYASRQNNIPAIIVMPETTPIAKINATKGYGAEVILRGDSYDDAYEAAIEIAKERGGTFVHPFDDMDVIAGQGTIAHEILKRQAKVDAIIVPAGGGGLLAGVAATTKELMPDVQVFGVQAVGADAIAQSFSNGKRTCLDKLDTIADGIAVKKPGELTVELINKYADGVATVTDEEIAATIMDLMEREKTMVEPAGATSLAFAVSEKFGLRGKKVACILSGGNVDISLIKNIIEQGLVLRKRKINFSVALPNKVGALVPLSKLIADNNANISRMDFDASMPKQQVLHLTCDVGGEEHSGKLMAAIHEHGYKILENGRSNDREYV